LCALVGKKVFDITDVQCKHEVKKKKHVFWENMILLQVSVRLQIILSVLEKKAADICSPRRATVPTSRRSQYHGVCMIAEVYSPSILKEYYQNRLTNGVKTNWS